MPFPAAQERFEGRRVVGVETVIARHEQFGPYGVPLRPRCVGNALDPGGRRVEVPLDTPEPGARLVAAYPRLPSR